MSTRPRTDRELGGGEVAGGVHAELVRAACDSVQQSREAEFVCVIGVTRVVTGSVDDSLACAEQLPCAGCLGEGDGQVSDGGVLDPHACQVGDGDLSGRGASGLDSGGDVAE